MNYTREQLEEMLDQLVVSFNSDIRYAVAKTGYEIEKFVNDQDVRIRQVVAQFGYGLDVLLKDSAWQVRAEVAKQGYGLDVLVNDRFDGVRMAVAEQGYGLDKLIDDDAWGVRVYVAQQGYGLDKLMYDEVYCVREAVANQGYGLDVLLNDSERAVREKALFRLREKEFMELQRSWGKEPTGYGPRVSETYLSKSSKPTAVFKDTASDAQLLHILNRLLSCRTPEVRCKLAEFGFGLDVLVDDVNVDVREAVAKQGYGLETLLSDCCYSVAYAARDYIRKHEGLDSVLKDAADRYDALQREREQRLRDYSDNFMR